MRRIQFSKFELDLELFQLRRGTRIIEIGTRALDLLVYLIENRERVVERAELRRAVWDSAALGRSSIPTCIRELRIALGDNASNPSLIETARGRGYRFIGTISNLQLEQDPETPGLLALPFVGRDFELSTIQEKLNSVVNEARCQVVLIQGAAGIGKTRLLGEFVARTKSQVKSYVATSPGLNEAPGFWPWTNILRQALTDQGHTNPDLTSQAQILSTVFPEIHDAADLLNAEPANLDRYSILSQWARAIRSISKRGPLLLAFEDIHHSDIDTLALLSWICDELAEDPVFILATHRPRAATDQIATRLSSLKAKAACTDLDLAPLSASQISAMLDPLIDDREILGQALWYRTSGNSFYVTHLIRHLGQNALAESADRLVSDLPPNAQEIVARQLSDLPISTREALAVASIAGLRFRISTLSTILKLAPEDLIRRLEPAENAWFISECGADYIFTHSLMRDALYQTVSSAKRRAVHLQLANALSDVSGPEARVAQIAEHRFRALPLGDADAACAYSLEAGREAATRFAHAKAQTFFHRALRIAEDDPKTTKKQRGAMMLELANAQLYEGDREAAYSTLQEAAHLARQGELPELLAACALQIAPDFLAIEIGSYDARLVSMLRESLKGVPQSSKSLRAQLLARLSHALLWSKDSQESENLAVRAVRLARQSGDTTSLNASLAARADSLTGPDRANHRMRVTKELQNTVRPKNSLPDSVMQHVRLVASQLDLGDMRAVDAAIDSCERISKEIDMPQYLWYSKTFRAMRKLMAGDFESTQRLAKESHELGERHGDLHGDENVRHSWACQTACILIEQNNAAVAIPAISKMSARRPLVRAWSAGKGYLHLLSGQLDQAVQVLESFDDQDLHLLYRETGGSAGIAFLAEIAAHTEDSKRQSTLYEFCCRASTRSATLGFAIAYFGCFSRYAGILAHKLGLTNEATEHLESAIHVESNRGALLHRAYAAIDLYRVVAETGGDREYANSLVEHLGQIASSPSFPRLSERLAETKQDALR